MSKKIRVTATLEYVPNMCDYPRFSSIEEVLEEEMRQVKENPYAFAELTDFPEERDFTIKFELVEDDPFELVEDNPLPSDEAKKRMVRVIEYLVQNRDSGQEAATEAVTRAYRHLPTMFADSNLPDAQVANWIEGLDEFWP